MTSDQYPGKPLTLAQACARLRFRHLQFLDILGRTRNLRLTAEQMHVTQPAATKILMDIEEILEARLFDRLSRGMRPNELGAFTLRYASAALDGQRRFVEKFNALKQGGHGHLTVGAITGSAAHLLVAAVEEIQRQRPLLVIKILEQSSDQLIAWLSKRKIDLMIGRFTDDAQRAQFHYERLSAEPLHVTGGPHHPLRGATDLALSELAHWPWILYPGSTAVRRVSDDLFGGAGLSLTAGVVETPSFLFALELMNTTHMLSLQSAALIQKYVDRGLLSRIPVELPDRMPSYGVITRIGEPPTPSAQAFIEVLRDMADLAPTPSMV
nr:LysR family transcriptional regulator [Variovorax boronicumulans]